MSSFKPDIWLKFSIGFVVLYLVMSFIFNLRTSDKQLWEDLIRRQHYNGIVEKIQKDQSNHNSITVYLSNKKKITTYPLYEISKLQIGDSLVKFKNQLSTSVYRNNEKINSVDLMSTEFIQRAIAD